MWKSYTYLLLFLLAVYFFFRYVLGYVLPFVLAIFLALAIEPWVRLVQDRLHLPRGLAVLLILVTAVAIPMLLGWLLLTRLTMELVRAVGDLPSLYSGLLVVSNDMLNWFGDVFRQVPPALQVLINRETETVYRLLSASIQRLATVLQAWVFQAIPHGLAVLVVTVLSAFFLSRDRYRLAAFARRLTPPSWQAGLQQVEADIVLAAIGFLKAETVLIGLTFLVVWIGLSWLGSSYAVLFAIFSALLDVLPVLGPGLLFVPWAIYAAVAGQPGLALALILLYAVVSGVRTVAQTFVIGENLGLHPLTVLVSMYVGVGLFGLAGFVLGPLVAMLLKTLVASGLLPIFEEQNPPRK